MSGQRRFIDGITATRDDLRRMSALAVSALGIAERAAVAPDASAKVQVREVERMIDGLEVAIEQRCHELMLEAPVAGDLRLLISAMRLAADLEHIGDLAQGVAKRFSSVALGHVPALPPDLAELARLPGAMLATAMAAFESGDLARIDTVAADERRSDDLAKACAGWIQEAMARQPGDVRELTQVLRAVYHFEQAADACVCIAEEAVFFHSGRLLRHQPGTGRFERS